MLLLLLFCRRRSAPCGHCWYCTSDSEIPLSSNPLVIIKTHITTAGSRSTATIRFFRNHGLGLSVSAVIGSGLYDPNRELHSVERNGAVAKPDNTIRGSG